MKNKDPQERSKAAHRSLHYYPGLDGLRGIWAIMVLAAHYGYLTAGWIPLEGFFVLSGFLITAILLGEKNRPFKQYVGRFYWRRVLRTFPAYFSFLFITCLVYASVAKGLPNGLPSLAGYWYNYYRLWGRASSPIFQHLWSMSVEEQFYLVWPFIVFGLSLSNLRRVLIGMVGVTLLAKVVLGFSLEWRGVSEFQISQIYYFATPLRLDAFGIGAAIAVFDLTKWTVRPRWVLLGWASAFLLGLINASFGHNPYLHIAHTPLEARFWGGFSLGYPLFLLQNKQFIWGYTVISLVSGLLIISATQGNKLRHFSENRLLVYLGRISYGLYIWHFLIFALIIGRLPSPWSFPGVICFGLISAASIGVAHVSYFGFERHFLLLKTCFSRRKESTIPSSEQRHEVAEASSVSTRITGAELAESITSIDRAGENSGEARHPPQEDRSLQPFVDQNSTAHRQDKAACSFPDCKVFLHTHL